MGFYDAPTIASTTALVIAVLADDPAALAGCTVEQVADAAGSRAQGRGRAGCCTAAAEHRRCAAVRGARVGWPAPALRPGCVPCARGGGGAGALQPSGAVIGAADREAMGEFGGDWSLFGGDWSLFGGDWCLFRGDWSLF